MNTVTATIGWLLVAGIAGAVVAILDRKIVTPFLAWLGSSEDKRPPVEERRGIVTRRTVQTQFWWAVAFALAIGYFLPTGAPTLLGGFWLLIVKTLTLWATFIWASAIVAGWDRKGEFFQAVQRAADGDGEALGKTLASAKEKVGGFRAQVEGLKAWWRKLTSQVRNLSAEDRAPAPPAPAAEPVSPPSHANGDRPAAPEPAASSDPRGILGTFAAGGSPSESVASSEKSP